MLASQEFDVIIIGGGLIGLAQALGLALGNFKVAVIEAQPCPLKWPKGSIDVRCSAFNLASKHILQHLQVWPDPSEISAFKKMHVWDALGFGALDFAASEVAEPALGYIIENRVITRNLQRKLTDNPNVSLIVAQAASLQEVDQAIDVKLDDDRMLRARLVVGADGGRSWLRSHLQVPTHEIDHQQTAIVANLSTERAHHQTAWQRFLPQGPIALLPLQDAHRCSLVWTVERAQAEALITLPTPKLCHELGLALDFKLGRVEQSQNLRKFELFSRHASHYYQGRCVLIGDAAHVIHPLAGQGINLGLLDVGHLLEVMTEARRDRHDWASVSVLKRFERRAKLHNACTLQGLAWFNRLFVSSSPSLVLLRSLGLSFPRAALKRGLIRHAMGQIGDRPALAMPPASA